MNGLQNPFGNINLGGHAAVYEGSATNLGIHPTGFEAPRMGFGQVGEFAQTKNKQFVKGPKHLKQN